VSVLLLFIASKHCLPGNQSEKPRGVGEGLREQVGILVRGCLVCRCKLGSGNKMCSGLTMSEQWV